MDLFSTVRSELDSQPSCLSPEALQHFRFREHQLIQLDLDLEKKRQHSVHAVEQKTKHSGRFAASPQQIDSTSFPASARACSATAASCLRESSCRFFSGNQRLGCESNSDPGRTGMRRARTAGCKRFSLDSGEEETRCDCPGVAAGSAKANATAAATKKHAKELVQLREAILKDPYVACVDVGSSVRAEYSAVFLPNRQAAEENSCSVDGTCRDPAALAAALEAQHSRMVLLQQELSTRLKETQNLAEELYNCKNQKRTLEDENEKLKKKVDQLAIQAERAKSGHAETCSKVELLEKTISDLKAENEKLTTSSQKSVSDLKTKEARLQRVTEEAASLRELLKDFKHKNKDSSSSLHKECEKLGAENKRLLSQRNELVQGFKKQMKLIDVLKRQKAHMEAARLLSFSEDEFLKILRIDENAGIN